MSIIRFSCDKQHLYVPRADGLLIDAPYANGVGHLGSVDDAMARTALRAHLDAQLTKHGPAMDQPVLVMVHGFLFTPYETPIADRGESDNPHVRVFHFDGSMTQEQENELHHTPWPLRMGYADADGGASGMAVAFGWHSSPGLASSLFKYGKNHYVRAYENGTSCAVTLRVLLCELRAALDASGRANTPIDLMCHSLGSHVVVAALTNATAELLRGLGRVLILGGAEYVQPTQVMYGAIRRVLSEGKGPVFYNVGCRENDVLDTLAENFGPVFFGNSQVIGHNGLAHGDPDQRWIDLQIDSPALQKWIKRRNRLTILGDGPGVWDHWFYYTHRPNCEWYKAILRRAPGTDLDAMRAAKIPEGITTNWRGD